MQYNQFQGWNMVILRGIYSGLMKNVWDYEINRVANNWFTFSTRDISVLIVPIVLIGRIPEFFALNSISPQRQVVRYQAKMLPYLYLDPWILWQQSYCGVSVEFFCEFRIRQPHDSAASLKRWVKQMHTCCIMGMWSDLWKQHFYGYDRTEICWRKAKSKTTFSCFDFQEHFEGILFPKTKGKKPARLIFTIFTIFD